MRRGRLLKKRVLHTLKQKLNVNFKQCGLLICKEHPFISVSPDAISEEYVMEIKCPASNKTVKNYISIEFIRIIDRIFDILNSQNPFGKGFKATKQQ